MSQNLYFSKIADSKSQIKKRQFSDVKMLKTVTK